METTGQKRIDTVAEDIKKLIADISNGKPAPITEENMNSFLNNVKEAMIAWNTPPVKEKYDGVLRMSILGKPARQLWYDKYSPCLLYTSPSPRDYAASRMPSSA